MSTDAPVVPGHPSAVPGDGPGPWRRSPIRKVILVGAIVFMIAFWIWALFFASKEAVNKINDTAWAERAETICVDYRVQLREFDAQASGDIQVRADLVDSVPPEHLADAKVFAPVKAAA